MNSKSKRWLLLGGPAEKKTYRRIFNNVRCRLTAER
jgi:hypothetical protein